MCIMRNYVSEYVAGNVVDKINGFFKGNENIFIFCVWIKFSYVE